MKNYKGFTLAELILAAAILAFVFSALLALFVNCSFLNEANRSLIVAATHGQYIMEDIRNTDFANIEANIDNGDWDLDTESLASEPYNLDVLRDELVNTEVSQSGDPLGVSVTVSWNDRKQRARNITLNTLITDYQ